jgi:hypothetical protein
MASELEPYAEEWLQVRFRRCAVASLQGLIDMVSLQFEQRTGGRFNLTGDIPTIRAQFLGLFNNMKGLLPPPSDAVKFVDMTILDGELPVRVYLPAKTSEHLLPIGL